jgi:hypothetical protein
VRGGLYFSVLNTEFGRLKDIEKHTLNFGVLFRANAAVSL